MTVQEAREALQDHTPSCGGYGSELKLEQHVNGVVVTLLADWAPRCAEPQALLLTCGGGGKGGGPLVAFRFPDHHGGWEDETQTSDAKGLLAWLGEQASEGG